MSETWAQKPADFQHQIDTVFIMATPVDGGVQVIDTVGSGSLQIALGTGRYNVTVYTRSATTFERYFRFSTMEAREIDTRNASTLALELITSQCLVLVPKTASGVNAAPIISDGAGNRRAMFSATNYYYVYARQTAVNQKFSYNPTNAYASDIPFVPYPGKVILWMPLDKTVEINVTDPFK